MDSKRLETAFFFLLLLIALTLAFFIFLPYLAPLILAVTFAVIFDPVQRRLVKFFGGRRGLAALVTLVLVLLIILIPVTFFGLQVINEATHVYAKITTSSFNPAVTLSHILPTHLQPYLPSISFSATQYIRSFFGWFSANFATIFTSITGLIIQLIIGLIALFYILKDGREVREYVARFLPMPKENTEKILNNLQATISSVVRGSLLVALLQAIGTGIAFTIFRVPNPAFWASINLLTALVPSFGTVIILVPAIIYLLATHHAALGLGLLIWGLFQLVIIDDFISPRLIRRGFAVHPLLILLSVIGGISVFGPIGFLLGPLILSLLWALLDISPSMITKN